MTTVSNFWPFAAVAASSLPAGSTLNPNARSFTPFVLNPDAKEFTPKQSEGQMQGQKCSTPDIRLDPPSPSDESSVRTPDNNALGECCQMAKFDRFLSLDCARVEGVGAQSKERKGSDLAA